MSVENTNCAPLKKSFLSGALFFLFIGAGLALYATNLTFKLTVIGIIDPSGCSFNDWFSCDTVLSTNNATMFGAPVAWWGFLYYLWAFSALTFAIINSKKPFGKSTAEAILFISLISVLITFFKIYQLSALEVICPVCVGMYIANFAIFLFLIKSLNISFKQIVSFELNYFKSIFTKKSAEQNSPHPIRFGVIFIWLFAMGYLGLKYYENTVIEPDLPNVKLILDEHFKQKSLVINTNDAPLTGNPEAKIKIVEFSDFECPSCKLLSSKMEMILLEYKNDVSFSFLNFPLDQSINENIKKEIHKNAGLAALAGVSAAAQDKFWSYQKELFENQTKLSREFLIELAVNQELYKDKFISEMDSDAAKQKVIQDIETGKSINVTGTPTLFINGRKVKYWNSPVVLKGIIEEEKFIANKK